MRGEAAEECGQPGRGGIESLRKLLTTVGSILDKKAGAHMDVYLSRM
jgi:hypothetical protein